MLDMRRPLQVFEVGYLMSECWEKWMTLSAEFETEKAKKKLW